MSPQKAAKPATASHGEPASNVEQLGGTLDNAHTSTATNTQRSLGSVEEIRLELVRYDADLQMREAGVDAGIVAEYAEAMAAGAQFSPVIVYFDGEAYWPADGFHRIGAARKIERETIAADVRQGGRRDAILHAVGVNANHGLRRTVADRRRAITTMLRDPEWTKWSDREIGKRCAADGKTVAKLRAELTAEFRTERVYTTRHGTIATMTVAPRSSGTSGSIMERMLGQATNEALIAECRRRKLEVTSDAD
jgi:hypothetical protein